MKVESASPSGVTALVVSVPVVVSAVVASSTAPDTVVEAALYVLEAAEISLFIRVSVVSLPTIVSVVAGSVN